MDGWILGDLFNDYSFVIAAVVGSLVVLGLVVDLVWRKRKAE
ncbi:hypothetical protein C8P63_13626 [Melghirimyces profundicolus]|uniref:Uncharacterized protein n=1 Tax=Melghirimyces profundicolus TaxID=1242148 RepID=A0A2T6B3L4_9BACL|nr:EYxxD motif small membrane protein [Melghirimyces profundicolus]PTX50644.1 hypothetical protein C8P63_13626 [Melghirimyces profundicolus]